MILPLPLPLIWRRFTPLLKGRSDVETIDVHLNGRDRRIDAGQTVLGLLESLELNPLLVVVELNKEILARDQFGDVIIETGDRLELVHFVGGG